MTCRRIIFVITTVILFTTAFVTFKWSSSESNLGIVLRCKEGVSGTLSIATVLQGSNEQQVVESFDVNAACEEGTLKFNHYISQENVLFVFKHNSGEITKLISEYGPDIQVDNHHGFYVVISILNVPPFIANDRI